MQEQPPKYVSPLSMWRSKLGLRAASIVFLIVLSALGGSLATDPRVVEGAFVMVVLAPAAVVTFIWNIAEGICILKRGGNRGIHPGAVVAVDLIAWLGWAIVDLLVVPYAAIARANYYVVDSSGRTHYVSDDDPLSPEDLAAFKGIQGKQRAMAAFAVLTTIVHLALFVIACYETNVRNRMPKTVYVMQPIYGPAPVQIPGGYSQLGSLPAQAVQGQPYPGQVFMQGQSDHFPVPIQPAQTLASGAKDGSGPERFA